MAYIAKKSMKHPKHIDLILEYVKEFFILMLEIPNIIEEFLFIFMGNL